jgi:p-hydroxybenzoate 3-monooxygenase
METSTVEVLAACGLDGRLREQGFEHRGIYLQWPEERHYLDFVLDV